MPVICILAHCVVLESCSRFGLITTIQLYCVLQLHAQFDVRQGRVECGVGSLLVTFKSRLSVPPYRIENMSGDVVIFFAQRSVAHQRSKWNWLTPAPGGNKMAYAWDEPIHEHYMTIRVSFTLHP